MEALKREADVIIKLHYTPASAATRACQLKKYMHFCEDFALVPIPCTSDRVVLFVAFMARTMKVSSIRDYLSGLNHYLKVVETAPINYANYRVHMALEGIKRKLGTAVKRASPLLPQHLKAMLAMLNVSMGHVAFRASILTSFRGLLRKQNVTESEANLLRGDVTMTAWGMMLNIRHSKTIQHGDRILRIPVARLREPALCAVYWVERHFREVPGTPLSPAFLVAPGMPLTYAFYSGMLNYAVGRAGLDPSLYSTHSLRRGGTSYLRSVGATIEELKLRGDWKSDAVFLYIQQPLEQRIAFDLRVALELDSV